MKKKPLPDIDDAKAASNLADYKSLTALAAIRAFRRGNFQNIEGCWASGLMDAEWVFCEKFTGRYFVSFGYHAYAVLLWEVELIGETQQYFQLSMPDSRATVQARDHLHFICTCDVWSPAHRNVEEEFEGVPTEVCCPWELPEGLKSSGIVLRRVGRSESLFRFWVQHGRVLDAVHLSSLVKKMILISGTAVELFQEKRAGVKSQLYSLIKAYFPERSDDQQRALLFKWVSPGKDKTVFSATYLGDILDHLGTEEDSREFQELKAKVDEERRVEYVLGRVGWSRAKAAHFTPSMIKKLRPPNSVLTWQMTSFCFQAYYPIPQALRTKAAEKQKEEQEKKKGKGKTQRKVKTHWARSRSYKEKRTKLDALVWVVEWLWKTHKQQGGDVSEKPTRKQISDALEAGEKPNADIDEEDEIPDDAKVGKKRVMEKSDSQESQESKKLKRAVPSSSSSSSSSSTSQNPGPPKGTKSFTADDKKASAAASSSQGKGKSKGAPKAKLLDTSGVKLHIRPETYQASLDAGDMKDRKKKGEPAPKKGRVKK